LATRIEETAQVWRYGHFPERAHIGPAGIPVRNAPAQRAEWRQNQSPKLARDLSCIAGLHCQSQHCDMRGEMYSKNRLGDDVRAFERMPGSVEIARAPRGHAPIEFVPKRRSEPL